MSSPKILQEDFRKFQELAALPKVLIFPVLFNNQYQKEYDEFSQTFPNRVFMIAKPGTYACRVSLPEALNKLLPKERPGATG